MVAATDGVPLVVDGALGVLSTGGGAACTARVLSLPVVPSRPNQRRN